ncbi:MAG: DUF1569 domain-containing protein [Adhaeribacter sp.]
MTKAEKSNAFLKEQVPALLAGLSPTQAPAWGRMTAQHMLEHLHLSLAMTRGIRILPHAAPWLLRPFYKWYMLSSRPFPKNIHLPGDKGQALPALRYGSLEEALENLLLALDDTLSFLRKNRHVRTSHPYAGPFTPEEWRIFHAKHFRHHLRQFRLLS